MMIIIVVIIEHISGTPSQISFNWFEVLTKGTED